MYTSVWHGPVRECLFHGCFRTILRVISFKLVFFLQLNIEHWILTHPLSPSHPVNYSPPTSQHLPSHQASIFFSHLSNCVSLAVYNPAEPQVRRACGNVWPVESRSSVTCCVSVWVQRSCTRLVLPPLLCSIAKDSCCWGSGCVSVFSSSVQTPLTSSCVPCGWRSPLHSVPPRKVKCWFYPLPWGSEKDSHLSGVQRGNAKGSVLYQWFHGLPVRPFLWTLKSSLLPFWIFSVPAFWFYIAKGPEIQATIAIQFSLHVLCPCYGVPWVFHSTCHYSWWNS